MTAVDLAPLEANLAAETARATNAESSLSALIAAVSGGSGVFGVNPVMVKALGSATGTSNTTTVPFTTTGTVAAGNTIIIAVDSGGTSAQALTSVSGGGLTWRVQASHSNVSGPTVNIATAYAPSGLASGTVITPTLLAAGTKKIVYGFEVASLVDSAAAAVSAGHEATSQTTLDTGNATAAQTTNQGFAVAVFAVNATLAASDWTLTDTSWTKGGTIQLSTSPPLVLLTATKPVDAGVINCQVTVASAVTYSAVLAILASTPITQSLPIQNMKAPSYEATFRARSGADVWVADRPVYINLNDPKYGCVGDGGASSPTENAQIINAALAGISGGGTAELAGGQSQNYGISHPILIPEPCELVCHNTRGGGTFGINSNFFSTTLNGAITTPASSSTTFTVTVTSTANAPGGVGGITVPGGYGVLTLGGIVVHYPTSGVTSTTFTGCRTWDLNKTIADTTPVSTFAIWLGPMSPTGAGFGARLKDAGIYLGTSHAGISGVYSAHLQENGGVFGLQVHNAYNFGLRIQSDPFASNAFQAVNYSPPKGIQVALAAAADANAVGIDILGQSQANNTPYDGQRGVQDFSVSCVGGSSEQTVKAMVRMNGVCGRYSDGHVEKGSVGFLVGDLYPAHVIIEDIGAANYGFSGGIVKIANTAGNVVDVRMLQATNPANFQSRIMIKDDLSSTSYTVANVDSASGCAVYYRKLPSGTVEKSW